ncbi:MAG: hypothetical protein QJR08_04295 [Bacillota bacterium]|nr:hypothetical protein [Bacillota bacterium]
MEAVIGFVLGWFAALACVGLALLLFERGVRMEKLVGSAPARKDEPRRELPVWRRRLTPEEVEELGR